MKITNIPFLIILAVCSQFAKKYELALKSLIFILIIIALSFLAAGCSSTNENIEPSQYDINGTWTGSGDFSISYLTAPAQMDLELIFNNDKFVELSYILDINGSSSEELFDDGSVTTRDNEIFVDIYNTSRDGTNRVKVFTFNGTILNETTAIGSLLYVFRDSKDRGIFTLIKKP